MTCLGRALPYIKSVLLPLSLTPYTEILLLIIAILTCKQTPAPVYYYG